MKFHLKHMAIALFFLFGYGMTVCYVGLHILQLLWPLLPISAIPLYWAIYIILVSAYVAGRIGQVVLPGIFSNALIKLGAYWLGLFFYLLLFFLIWDIGQGLCRWLSISVKEWETAGGWSVILLAVGSFVWGVIHARTFRTACYSIQVNKACPVAALHALVVTDAHFGLFTGQKRLKELIDRIIALQPDIIFWPGDIFDETVGTFLDENMNRALRRLTPPLGMYACLGSHEYIGGSPEKAITALAKVGITVLRDESVFIADSFYVAGRDDVYRKMLTGEARKTVGDILAGCDRLRPIILLNHYPSRLKEALQAGVDMQISGHTHEGQLFPMNLLAKLIFPINAGYRELGPLQVIVSSGWGTWLLPLRVGTTGEIVSVRFSFSSI